MEVEFSEFFSEDWPGLGLENLLDQGGDEGEEPPSSDEDGLDGDGRDGDGEGVSGDGHVGDGRDGDGGSLDGDGRGRDGNDCNGDGRDGDGDVSDGVATAATRSPRRGDAARALCHQGGAVTLARTASQIQDVARAERREHKVVV